MHVKPSSSFLLLLLSSTALTGGAMAQTLPSGGAVAHGAATIGAPSNGQMTITQTSPTAIVNWQSFSIGAGGRVDIQQPGPTSAMLNRVTGNTPSTIAGQLNANGQVFLVNPNGVTISKSGVVNAGAFVASTLNITDEDFIAGRHRFAGNGASASVVNQGQINIARGGFAALLGGSVDNSGTISVPMGRVALGSGEQATLDFTGDGFLQIAVPTNAQGDGPLIRNSGKISAPGGRVELSAATARHAVRHAINMSGVIEATGVSGRNGAIVFSGGDGGSVKVSGHVNAGNAGGVGGHVTMTGRRIALRGATVDASGATGGGTIRIGDAQQTQRVKVDAATRINADATQKGKGGDVTVWSQQRTGFEGAISARGGAQGGDGGAAEVSSRGVIAYTGTADLRAPQGKWGTLLLDPYNITISNAADSNQTSFTPTGNDSVINATTLTNALASAHVTVSTGLAGSAGAQAGDIAVTAPLAWKTSAMLTLQAANNIALNADITAPAGALTLDAGGAITSTGATTLNLFALTQGAWTQNAATLPAMAVADFQLNGGSFLRAAGGDGSNANPYKLTDIYGVQGIGSAATLLGQSYRLIANPDAILTSSWNNGAGFKPIGDATTPFTGRFDGRNQVIGNLTINRPAQDQVGMFGNIGAAGVVDGATLIDANIRGRDAVGAVAGVNAGTLTHSSSTGDIIATGADAGGVAGRNSGALSYAYSAANVTAGAGAAGGLVGRNAGTLTQTWASGPTSGGALGGGLIGDNVGTLTASYWDTETTGQSAAAGAGDQTGATGLTEAQARQQQNYIGWDFANVWFQNQELRPIGRWEAATPGADGYALIDNLRQLELISANPGANYRLTRDIDASALIRDRNKPASLWGAGGFMPIGIYTISYDPDGNPIVIDTPFSGEFDGAGHHIVDLFIDRLIAANTGSTDFNAALFRVSTGYLHDIGLTGGAATASLNGPSIYGGVASTPGMGFSGVGALVGWNQGRIDRAYSTLNVGGLATVGGLVGMNTNYGGAGSGSITDSFTLGGAHPGMAANVTLGTEPGEGQGGGGLVGYNEGGDISRSFSTMSVYGQGLLGGLVGWNQPANDGYAFFGGNLTDVYATGDVMAPLDVSSGIISSVQALGGLVGASEGGVIQRAYATGQVGNLTAQYVGGLVGSGYSVSFNEVYASGKVEADPFYPRPMDFYSGGVVGTCPRCNYINTFWDTQTTGIAEWSDPDLAAYDSRTRGSHEDRGDGIRLWNHVTTAQARTQAPYAAQGWDFSTNWYQSGDMRPMLRALANVGPQPVAGVTTVYTPLQLQLSALNPGGAYRLGHDIDASETSGADAASVWGPGGFQPLGNATTPFTGSLDGGGHSIANLAINRPGENNVGLIGVQQSGAIQNIRLTNANIVGGDNVGALVGAASGSVLNSMASGVVSGLTNVGGLIGRLTNAGGVNGAYTTTTVTASSGANGDIVAGGLIGANDGSILNAYATGTTTATGAAPGGGAQRALAGGLVGKNTGSIGKTYATGASSASGATQNHAGAVVGDNAGTVTDTLFDTQTTGRANGAGTGAGTGMTGATTAQMQDIDTFRSRYAGWDFANIWSPPNRVGQSNNSPTAYYPELYALSNITAVTPVAGAVTRVYGDPNPTRPFAAYDGLHAGDIMRTPGTLTSAATTASPIGVYSASIDGAQTYDVANATWRYVYVPGADLTVTQRPLAVAADAQTRAYGDVNPTLSYTVGARGLVNGDTLSGALTTAATTASAVGNYAIDQGSLAATSNYAMSFIGNTLAVTQRPLAVAADAQTRAYGDVNPTLTWTVGARGLVNGDTLSGALATAATTASNVGSYAIDQGSLAATSNYAMSFIGNTLAVRQRPLAVSADAQTRAYGDVNPALTWTVGARGLVNGDTLSGALTTSATTASNVASYAIDQGSLAATGNYAMSFTGNTLAVTQRPLAVSADAQTRAYGDANPTLTYTIGERGLVNGDTLSGALTTAATAASNVGNYAIDQGSLAATSNYAMSFIGNTLAVTQRPLAVSADAQTRAYGDVNPTLSYTVGARGLVNGDTLSGALATSATTASSVGSYAIDQGSLAATGNYAMSFTGNSLAVTQRPLAVSADAQTRAYGDANPTLTYTVGARGLVNGDTLSGALATAATTASNVGSYAIDQGSLAATGNYAMSFTGNMLAVTQRPLTVSADAQTRAYGDVNPALTWTVGARGLVNGDTLSGALTTSATTASPPGDYDITQGTLAASPNYAMIFSPNFLTVQGETPPQPPSPRPTPVYDLRLTLAQATIGLPPLVSDLVRLNTMSGARHYSTRPFGAGESPPSIRYHATTLCLGDDRYGLNCPVLPSRRFTPAPPRAAAR